MKTTYTRYNARDFTQRYVDTYGWLIRDDGTRMFVYVKRAEDGRLYYETDGNMEYYATQDKGQEFEFIPVNKGWFNSSNGNPMFLNRVPARQWKRGISGSNTELFAFNGNKLFQWELNYKKLSTIFNKDFEKNNYPKDFKLGALSKHFCVDDTYKLRFYDTVIGDYNPQENVFYLSNNIVAQELRDLIHRNNWSVHVSTSA